MSLWIKRSLGALVVLHFACILSALIAPAMPGAASPALPAAFYARISRHYLEPLAMTSPHRYYAPDISPFCQVWFRASFAGGGVRWLDVPGGWDHWLPMRYQRRFGISMALDSATQPAAEDGQAQTLTPLGGVLVSSYARHVARSLASGTGAVREVQVYQVAHRIRTPVEVRRGWSATDPRLYAPRYLGTCDSEGKLVGGSGGTVESRCISIPMSVLMATILREDVKPAPDRTLVVGTLPGPVRELVIRSSSLVEQADAADFPQRLRSAVEALDAPRAPGGARSQVQTTPDW